MAYCTYATDVQSIVPQFVASTTSTPTSTQCASIIGQIDAKIDAVLRARGVTTPVTDTDALAILKVVSATGAGAAILRAAFPFKEGIGGEGGAATALQAEFDAWLKRLEGGLLDSDAKPSASSVAHGFHHWHHPLRHHHHHEAS